MKKSKGEKWEKGLKGLKGGGGLGTIRRMKFPVGTSIIRLVDNEYEEAWIHHFPGVNDAGEEATRRTICLGRATCPICKLADETENKDLRAKHRFYMNIIDRKEEKADPDRRFDVKLLECGPSIFEQIATFAVDSEYGDPTKYNFKIIRVGTGARDTKYNVIPSSKFYKISKRERKLCERATEEGGKYLLTGFTEKRTKDEVEAMLGKAVEEETEEIEEEERKLKKKKKKIKGSVKKKKKKFRTKEDEVDFD